MRKKSRDEEKISISKSICLLVCAFIYVIPVIMVFVNAFKPLKEIQGNFWALPKNFMLENFQTAFGLMDFGEPVLIQRLLLWVLYLPEYWFPIWRLMEYRI